MKNYTKWITVSLIVVFLMTGCASKNTLTMTYRSDPSGAMLYKLNDNQELGRPLGRTPLVVNYELSPEHLTDNYVSLEDSVMIWKSEAWFLIDIEGTIPPGLAGGYTAVRPDSFAGRDIDLQVARDLRQRQLEKQAQADTRAATYQPSRTYYPVWGAFTEGFNRVQRQQQNSAIMMQLQQNAWDQQMARERHAYYPGMH